MIDTIINATLAVLRALCDHEDIWKWYFLAFSVVGSGSLAYSLVVVRGKWKRGDRTRTWLDELAHIGLYVAKLLLALTAISMMAHPPT